MKQARIKGMLSSLLSQKPTNINLEIVKATAQKCGIPLDSILSEADIKRKATEEALK